MTHTPGPWHVYRANFYGKQENEQPLCIGTKHLSICELTASAGHIEESMRDARLIAAAPELLKACEAAFALFQEQVRILCGAGYTTSEHDDEVDALLRAALAKARGPTPPEPAAP